MASMVAFEFSAVPYGNLLAQIPFTPANFNHRHRSTLHKTSAADVRQLVLLPLLIHVDGHRNSHTSPKCLLNKTGNTMQSS